MGVHTIPEVTLRRVADHEVTAIITASGAAIRRLEVDGRPLLKSFEPAHRPPGAANIVLAPWPNRVADATFTFNGVTHQLDVTEPERGHALHGFTWGRIFSIEEHMDDSATLRTVLGPEPGWPWQIELTVMYTLTDTGIDGAMTARNITPAEDDHGPAPCALGVHTYLDPQGAPLDECTLHHTIEERQPLDSRNIPASPREPWPASPMPMNGVWLDDAGIDSVKRPRVARLVSKGGYGVELEASISMPWTQVFTSPQRELAVEPMTAPPNALNSGEDLTVLAPGERMSVSWSVRAIHN